MSASGVRYVYVSRPGGKPLSVGINQAKRVARRADERDQRAVQAELGFGLPRQRQAHQALVRRRHAYYHEQHEAHPRGSVGAS